LPEEREFSPHLTLARLSQYTTPDEIHKTGEILVNYHPDFNETFLADAVNLFRSDIQPGGAVYTSLINAPLDFPTKST